VRVQTRVCDGEGAIARVEIREALGLEGEPDEEEADVLWAAESQSPQGSADLLVGRVSDGWTEVVAWNGDLRSEVDLSLEIITDSGFSSGFRFTADDLPAAGPPDAMVCR
jgi:hypothetical protein